MKVGGVWKNATAGWVKVAGVWRKFFSAQASAIVEIINMADTNSGSKTYTVTAAQAVAGSRLIAMVHCVGQDADIATMAETGGGTWTRCVTAKNGSTRGTAIFLRNEPLTGASFAVSWAAGASATGSGMSLRRIDGAPGLTLRQVGKTDSAGSGAPSATFPAAPSPDSVMMASVVMPSGGTAVPVGWGYGYGLTYTLPSTSIIVASRLSGETLQTISFVGSVVASTTAIAEFAP